MWGMNLESIIQGKVSQKEKDKHHILTYIYICYIYIYIYIYMESRKMVLENLLTGQQLRSRHSE